MPQWPWNLERHSRGIFSFTSSPLAQPSAWPEFGEPGDVYSISLLVKFTRSQKQINTNLQRWRRVHLEIAAIHTEFAEKMHRLWNWKLLQIHIVLQRWSKEMIDRVCNWKLLRIQTDLRCNAQACVTGELLHQVTRTIYKQDARRWCTKCELLQQVTPDL